jgi:hypothetical protein
MQFRPDYKFIFVHIPKTAGSSITDILDNLPPQPISLDLQLTTHLFRRTLGRRYRPVSKHAKASEIKNWVGSYAWNRCFTFAFIRNPWDLMVSTYFWWLEKAPKFEAFRTQSELIQSMAGFKEFLFSEYGQKRVNQVETDLLDYLTDSHGKIIVDFVARFETLHEDWRTICKTIQIENVELPHLNKGSRQDYRIYYDSHSREMIANRFREYINTFNYSFE